MNKTLLILCVVLLAVTTLIGCSSQSGNPAAVLTDYFTALVDKDASKLEVLSCADYAQQSQLLLESFSAVETKLADLACSELENDGTTASVKCTGNIVATSNGEDQELDLSTMTYTLINHNGDWLVCGIK